MQDNRPAAVIERERQLKASFRDLTATETVPGRTGDSLRNLRGFSGITDEMLKEREAFRFKAGRQMPEPSVDLSVMSPEELDGLQAAVESEAKNRKRRKNGEHSTGR